MAGKKGRSGRRSAKEEWGDLKAAEAIFFSEHDQEALERKIQSGKFSIKDRFILTAMEGDTTVITKAYHKAVPDNVDVTTGGEKLPVPIMNVFEDNSYPQNKPLIEED